MVEIRYAEHYEVADLAGLSVAEVRKQYKQEFGIPDKAQASLDGKGIGQKQEPTTWLSSDDKLSFAEKSRKGLVLVGTFLLALAVTGGTFAYTAISAGVTAEVVTTPSEYALVVPAQEDISSDYTATKWKVSNTNPGTLPNLDPIWKGGIGEVEEGDLFYIDPKTYTGDLSIRVSLTNQDDLVYNYRFIAMAVNLWYWDTDHWAQVTNVSGHGGVRMLNEADSTHYYWLTLRNGEVIFDGLEGKPYEVTIDRGSFYTYFGGSATAPMFSCDVAQAGLAGP